MCQAPQPSFAKSVTPILEPLTEDLRSNGRVEEVSHPLVQPFEFNGGRIRLGTNSYSIAKVELSPLQIAIWL